MRPLIIAISLLLASCATVVEKPPANADYGAFPDDYQDLIKSYLARRLIDPDSARYEFDFLVRKAFHEKGLWYEHGTQFLGYAVTFTVNAKNHFGGYTGRRRFIALIRNGVVHDAGPVEDVPTVHFPNE